MGQRIYYHIPPVLTRKQLQETLHISKTTALWLIKEKEIPASRAGNKYLVQREDVLDFLERCGI